VSDDEAVPEAQARLKAWLDGFSIGPRDYTPYANPGELKADVLGLLSVVATLQQRVEAAERHDHFLIAQRTHKRLEAAEAELTAARERETRLREALAAEIKRVCECDGEDHGNGPGVAVIDCERSSFDYGADAYDGAGNVITDYFDCPCAPLRAALVVSSPPPGGETP
jgi:hypothetical protein